MPGDTIEYAKIDKKKFQENFDSIDWGDLKDKPLPKTVPKKRFVGLCGEFGMSVFDKKAFDNNFDQIDWSVKPKESSDESEEREISTGNSGNSIESAGE